VTNDSEEERGSDVGEKRLRSLSTDSEDRFSEEEETESSESDSGDGDVSGYDD
jgi:hypothetical protein